MDSFFEDLVNVFGRVSFSPERFGDPQACVLVEEYPVLYRTLRLLSLELGERLRAVVSRLFFAAGSFPLGVAHLVGMAVVVLEGAVDLGDIEIEPFGHPLGRMSGLPDEPLDATYRHAPPLDVRLRVKVGRDPDG